MATPADFEAIGEVFRRSIREVAARDYSPEQIATWSSHADDTEIWADRIRNRMNFLAVDEDHILGFLQYDPPGHIDMTYVRPEFVRKGVARALLAALESTAVSRGVTTLHTEASITARPFFEACGYELVAPQIVRVRGVEFLNFRMRKAL